MNPNPHAPEDHLDLNALLEAELTENYPFRDDDLADRRERYQEDRRMQQIDSQQGWQEGRWAL